MPQKPDITLVGAGRLARSLAALLPAAGYRVVEFVVRDNSASRRRAATMAKALGAELATIKRAQFSGRVVWFAVSDSAIRECAQSASRDRAWKGKIALHSSGALTSDELASLRAAGAAVASIHPMMTFVAGRTADVHGVSFAVEGDRRAVAAAQKIARALGGKPFVIGKEAKSLYHAFGAFLSPLLVSQMHAAAQLAAAAGVPRRDLSSVMQPIVLQTLENFFSSLDRQETGGAFTGPLVRGDVETIRKHLKALDSHPRERALYLALTRAAVDSKLPVKDREAIRRLLK